jgi:tetratricopeptide (TPR) repeat protein
LRIRETSFGKDHPNTANTQMHLARCRLKLGDTKSAESLARLALATQESRLSAGHPEIAATQTLLARILVAREAYEEAETLFLAGLESLQARWFESSVACYPQSFMSLRLTPKHENGV